MPVYSDLQYRLTPVWCKPEIFWKSSKAVNDSAKQLPNFLGSASKPSK
ncbi:MAG: hypothetical protein ACI4UX_01450 [Clostridia bacterium]